MHNFETLAPLNSVSWEAETLTYSLTSIQNNLKILQSKVGLETG